MSNNIDKNNWNSFSFIDLFAGIGGIRIGFESLGGYSVFASEWDKSAQITYEVNFGEKPKGDITKISPNKIPNHDILLAGFPCQPFSVMGDKKGFSDTRGTLFFNIEMILREKKPTAFLLENVKQLTTHDNGRTFKVIIEHLEALGYYTHSTILNSLHFGVPQKRERTFIVGFKENLKFKFPCPLNVVPKLEDVLEPEELIDKSLFVSDSIRESRKEKCKVIPFYPSVWHENKSGNISLLPYSCALRAQASYNYLLINGIRRPSSRELLRFQGFPDTFKIPVSYTQIRKQAGNSVAVPVVKAIAKEMIISLKQGEFGQNEVKQCSLCFS